jgi:hypothetical protein
MDDGVTGKPICYSMCWRLIVTAKDRESALSCYRSLARRAELPGCPEQTAPYEKLAGTWEATVCQSVDAMAAGDVLALALRRMHRLGMGWLTTECEFEASGILCGFGAIFDARQFSRLAAPKLIWCSLDVCRRLMDASTLGPRATQA